MIAIANRPSPTQSFQQFGRPIPSVAIPELITALKWRGADLQTMRNVILGPALSLDDNYERVSFDLPHGESLQAALHKPDVSHDLPLIIIIHGLAGDETSPNVISAAAHFLALGYPVLRLNLRGAGPSALTSVGPYHGGLCDDLDAVVTQVASRSYGAGIILYGISLGGNMMLKYLGKRGKEAAVRGAIAVSAPLDLKSVQVRLMSSRNRLYHNYLLLGMKKYAQQMSGHYDEMLLSRAQSSRSLFEFDDQFTAPAHGMAGAEDYYRKHSAGSFVDQIQVPTLMIHAENDPWIPVEDYYQRDWTKGDMVSLVISKDGGHVGFHGKGHNIPWHDRVAAAYFTQICRDI